MSIDGQVNSFRIYEIKRNTRQINKCLDLAWLVCTSERRILLTEQQGSGLCTDVLLFLSHKASEIIHDY